MKVKCPLRKTTLLKSHYLSNHTDNKCSVCGEEMLEGELDNYVILKHPNIGFSEMSEKKLI